MSVEFGWPTTSSCRYMAKGVDQFGHEMIESVVVPPPLPSLYFWLGRDAEWPVVSRLSLRTWPEVTR